MKPAGSADIHHNTWHFDASSLSLSALASLGLLTNKDCFREGGQHVKER